MYINDIVENLNLSQVYFFVDGTSFSYSSCDILQIITMIDHVLKRDGGMINEIMYAFLTRIKQKWTIT
jgi:hypothetical protein